MKKRTLAKLFFVFTVVLILTSHPLYAATPTPTVTNSAISDAEIEREKQIVKELSLNMPDQTDDPNYPVTFVDPSKQGVDITIDDKTYTKAANPFLIPNIAIGEHKVIFKFKTKDGVVRVLTKKLLVTPKAPQFDPTIKTEVVRPNSVTLKGTALPQATVMLVINSQNTHKITSTPEGKWEFIVPDPAEGINNVVAFTIKNGIVSTPSKTFSLVYKLNEGSTNTQVSGEAKENQLITFAKTIYNNIEANRKERPTIFYGVIGAAVLGILILIDVRLRKRAARNRDAKTIETLFGNMQKEGGNIVEAIQSVKDTVTGKKKKMTEPEVEKPQAPPKIKKALAELEESLSEQPEDVSTDTEGATQEDVQITTEETTAEASDTEVKPEAKSEPTIVTSARGTTVSKVLKNDKKTKKMSSAKTKVIKSEPLTEVEESETDEPEKKVLSKEEFLKQFKKGPGQV